MTSLSHFTSFAMILSIEESSKYGYRSTLFVCILYVSWFSVSTATHLIQMFFSHYWFLAPTTLLASVLETLDWVGRTWSNQTLLLGAPFTIQICCLTIGSTPLLAAADFVIFGRSAKILGTGCSRLSSYLYIVSLTFQSVGGAMASTPDNSSEDFNTGDRGTERRFQACLAVFGMSFRRVVYISVYVVSHHPEPAASSSASR
ncbi:putative rta1-like protein [Moniliophthora roreri]|nr:putative rta1-like protein [Moniliophthora roreri]